MFVLSFQFAILQTFGRGLRWWWAALAKYMIVCGSFLMRDYSSTKQRSAEILAQLYRVTVLDEDLSEVSKIGDA